ncbi:hypothetical protein SVAN01_08356 [Stagonosporopsis vannaccii]|nr:hypothetical protein SVAN01_08356 [Stagonosporopsis vannaccii]
MIVTRTSSREVLCFQGSPSTAAAAVVIAAAVGYRLGRCDPLVHVRHLLDHRHNFSKAPVKRPSCENPVASADIDSLPTRRNAYCLARLQLHTQYPRQFLRTEFRSVRHQRLAVPRYAGQTRTSRIRAQRAIPPIWTTARRSKREEPSTPRNGPESVSRWL